jgi:hypothetical protein
LPGLSAERAFSEMELDPYEVIEAGDRIFVLTILMRTDGRPGGPSSRDLLQTAFNDEASSDRCFLRPPRGPAVARFLLLLAI